MNSFITLVDNFSLSNVGVGGSVIAAASLICNFGLLEIFWA
jgi:hypothetical protein